MKPQEKGLSWPCKICLDPNPTFESFQGKIGTLQAHPAGLTPVPLKPNTRKFKLIQLNTASLTNQTFFNDFYFIPNAK